MRPFSCLQRPTTLSWISGSLLSFVTSIHNITHLRGVGRGHAPASFAPRSTLEHGGERAPPRTPPVSTQCNTQRPPRPCLCCLSKYIGLWSEIIFRPKSLVRPQRPMELLAPSYPGNTLPPSPSAARHPTSQWCQIYHSLPPRIPTATTADITSALQMCLGRNQLSAQNISYSCSNVGTIGFDPVATLHYYPSATTAATSRTSRASAPSATNLQQPCITTLLQPPQMYLGRNQLSVQNVS